MGAALSQPAFVPVQRVQAPLPLSPAASSQGASPAIDRRAHASQPSHALAGACLASAGSVSLRLARSGRWKKPRGRGHQVLRLAAATDVPVDRERYTDAAWQAMQDGPQIAQRCQSQYVEPEHVFLACLEQQVSTTGGLCARILEKVGITQQAAKDRVMEPWNSKRYSKSQLIGFGVGAERPVASRVEQQTAEGASLKSAGLHCCRQLAESQLNQTPNAKDTDFALRGSHLCVFVDARFSDVQVTSPGSSMGNAAGRSLVTMISEADAVTSQNPESTYEALKTYGTDLTSMAREGKLDPVIGRDDEIRRVIQILARRSKNNPVSRLQQEAFNFVDWDGLFQCFVWGKVDLRRMQQVIIGEPGVGKTAIVEGLARRIIDGDVPQALKDKEVISLDIGGMVAGAKFRGLLEACNVCMCIWERKMCQRVKEAASTGFIQAPLEVNSKKD
eukprot:Skav222371  [mRNA]  locus=scaffold2692:194512:199164:+ [translate_table: standard]